MSNEKRIAESRKNRYAQEEWRKFVEGWKHAGYSPGGIIIWPCHAQSINQCRGVSKVIRDRFDRTLECIRRYYKGEDSPLGKCLERDKGFFNLFESFKGFVDFFHLQDLVTPDYSEVTMWIGDAAFTTSGFPQTPEEYWQMIDRQRQFLKARNRRITNWAAMKGH